MPSATETAPLETTIELKTWEAVTRPTDYGQGLSGSDVITPRR
jgi:hypothetical protein